MNGRLVRTRASAVRAWALGAVLSVLAAAGPAVGQYIMPEPPPAARGLEVTEHLGETLPLDLKFRDHDGQTVALRKYFDFERKPVIIAMIYYDCPLLCPMMMGKLQQSLNELDWTVGEDFTLVAVSFDPADTTALAASARESAVASYRRSITPVVRSGFNFLTGDEASSKALADALGFKFRYMPEVGEYSHGTVLFVASPEGVISRYLYGIEYPSSDLRFSLLEASEGRISESLKDRIMLWCYHFDPKAGTYTLQAMRLMQAGSALTVVLLGGLLSVLWWGERRRRARRLARGGEGSASASAETEAEARGSAVRGRRVGGGGVSRGRGEWSAVGAGPRIHEGTRP